MAIEFGQLAVGFHWLKTQNQQPITIHQKFLPLVRKQFKRPTSYMAANQIEIILSRQLADCLNIPVFLIDPNGNLLFYNEPAEEILGKRYEEAGKMPMEEWSTVFKQADGAGEKIPPEKLPLVSALTHHKPMHGELTIESLKGEKYTISVTAIPIIGRPDRFLGAMAIFWKSEES